MASPHSRIFGIIVALCLAASKVQATEPTAQAELRLLSESFKSLSSTLHWPKEMNHLFVHSTRVVVLAVIDSSYCVQVLRVQGCTPPLEAFVWKAFQGKRLKVVPNSFLGEHIRIPVEFKP